MDATPRDLIAQMQSHRAQMDVALTVINTRLQFDCHQQKMDQHVNNMDHRLYVVVSEEQTLTNWIHVTLQLRNPSPKLAHIDIGDSGRSPLNDQQQLLAGAA